MTTPYILIETCERNIKKPACFPTLSAARTEMGKRVLKTLNIPVDKEFITLKEVQDKLRVDYSEDEADITYATAYCMYLGNNYDHLQPQQPVTRLLLCRRSTTIPSRHEPQVLSRGIFFFFIESHDHKGHGTTYICCLC